MRAIKGLLFLGGMLVGCDSGEVVEHPRGEEAWAMAHSQEVEESDVVARVDGRAITRQELELVWREHPQWQAEQVLTYLVEREVLVQKARQEGYLSRPEVDFARKQGMVSALLTERVEGQAEIDESKEARLREMVHLRRRVPEGLRASHLVVLVPSEVEKEEGKKQRLQRQERELYFEQGLRYLEQALELLEGRTDDDALREVAERLNDGLLSASFEAAVNEHLRFPRAAVPFRPEQLPRGWNPVVREFAEGAETVASDGRRGELSEPVRTEFGWHLIRVDAVLEERPVDPEELEFFVQDQLLLDAHISRLGEEIKIWFEGARIEKYPERLERGFGTETF